jgi:hypothetical protein
MSRSSLLQINNNSLDKLTMNKFDMESVGLIGREREIATLKSCLERMIAKKDDHTTEAPT